MDAACRLGTELASRGIRLIYGGGSVGLMGAVADAVLAANGQVTGVIPEFLATRELLHPGIADMRIVESMHVRKALMTELCDAFIALPGGYGTYEELLETITWAQLGLHAKPIGLLNTRGFYEPLVRCVDHSIEAGFIKANQKALLFLDEDPARLLDRLSIHELPEVRSWLNPDQI